MLVRWQNQQCLKEEGWQVRALFQRRQTFKLTRPKQAPQEKRILQTEMHEAIELTVPAVSRSNRDEVDHSGPCKLQLTMQKYVECSGRERNWGREISQVRNLLQLFMPQKSERLDVPQAMKTARQTSHWNMRNCIPQSSGTILLTGNCLLADRSHPDKESQVWGSVFLRRSLTM